MAAAAPAVPPVVDPFSAHSHFHAEPSVDGDAVMSPPPSPPPRVVNDLLLRRVREGPYAPFFAYPATPRGKDDYVYHTVGDIDNYANAAARFYLHGGVVPEVHSFPS